MDTVSTVKRLWPVIVLAVVLSPIETTAQRLEFVSFILENDFLFLQDQSDKYYTNGFRYERIGPRFDRRHKVINNLLITFSKSKDTSLLYYGSFFGQNIYTPQFITLPKVQTDDRPYAGWTYWGAKSISTNRRKNQRITSELSIGLLGPQALAGEVQTFVHKIVHSDIPEGWSHQVDSDLGINYMVKYEIGKQLRTKFPIVEVIGFGKSTLGTIFTNIAAGGVLSIGQTDNYFNIYTIGSNSIESLTKKQSKPDGEKLTHWQHFVEGFSQYFFFVRPHVRYDFYNAMLQGGVLNKGSEYTIPSKQVTSLLFQSDFGVAVTWYSLTAMYSQSIRSQEFSYGPSTHSWGSINIIYAY